MANNRHNHHHLYTINIQTRFVPVFAFFFSFTFVFCFFVTPHVRFFSCIMRQTAFMTQDDMATFNERLARYYAGESPSSLPGSSSSMYNDDGNVRRAGTWSAGTTKSLKRNTTGRISHMVARTEKESRGFLERSWSKLFKSKKEKTNTAFSLSETSPVWYSQFSTNPSPTTTAAAGQHKRSNMPSQYYDPPSSRMASVSA